MLLDEIASSCPPHENTCPAHLSLQCWDFLSRLLVPEVDRRSGVEEALGHQWLAYLPWQHVPLEPDEKASVERAAPGDVSTTATSEEDSFLLTAPADKSLEPPTKSATEDVTLADSNSLPATRRALMTPEKDPEKILQEVEDRLR